MRASSRSVLAAVLALAGVGCTGGDVLAVAEADVQEGSVGVLHVERLADGELSGRTELSAAFARYRGLDAGSVLGLLGSRSAAELESCTFVGEGENTVAEYGEVELLDVGTIRVRVAGTEANLAPRAFPDLASVLAGVFYAGDATLAVPRGDIDEYAFLAAGSDEVPAFDAVVPAPSEASDLRVDGSAASEMIALVRGVAMSREEGVELGWSAGDPRDVIEIEIHAHGDVIACAARDDGAFRIDSESLATLAPDVDASLVVRRVRVTPVDVPGLDDAYARVSVTREIDAELR